jgi:SAF domain-containing protein
MPPVLAVALAAVQAALALPGAHAEVLRVDGAPARCEVGRAEVPRPVAASGSVAIHLSGSDATGRPCEAWVWAEVRLRAPTLVTSRPVPAGEPLQGAVATVEREVRPGRTPLAALPEGARADRALPAGTALDDGALRVGPRPGEPVTVLLRSGALAVEQRGTAVSCRRGRACALLPSGRRVEGTWHGGRIELEAT